MAQIINQQSAATNNGSQQEEEGTIPGLYYDPSGEPAPTFANSTASEEAGSIRLPSGSQAPSYLNGAWPVNASSDQVLKIGNLKDHPQFKQFTDLSINQVLKAGGKDPGSVTLADVPLASSMTLEQYLQINPEAANQSLENAPAVVQSAFGYYEDDPLSNEPLSSTDTAFIQQKASNSEISNIPAKDLLEGDWGEAFSREDQNKLAQTLGKVNERISKLPLKQILPIAQGVISGDWDSVKAQAKDIAIKEGSKILVKELLNNPQIAGIIKDLPLGTLPLDKLGLSDAPGVGDASIKDIPGINDKTVNQIPGLNELPLDQISAALALSFTRFDLLGTIDTTDAAAVVDDIDNVLSGGTKDQIPRPAPCKIGGKVKNCRHFELDNINGGGEATKLSGKAWVQGSDQPTEGGKGWLRVVNGGKEPTGIKPWIAGNVKLVLEDIKEGSGDEVGSARLSTAWQYCYTDLVTGLHCTPHFLVIPTPYRIKEGGVMLLLARTGSIPEAIRDLQPNQQQFCQEPTLVAAAPPQDGTTTSDQPPGGTNGSAPPKNEQHYVNQYLARIAYGESSGGTDIGPHPDTGAYGEYQFLQESRDTLYQRTGIDAWSTDKKERDQAALAWIDIYGREVGQDVIGYIKAGNFEAADAVLGRNQFTSLPGGAEAKKWNNPVALQAYGPNGNAPTTPTGATAVSSNGGSYCQPQTPSGPGTFAQGPAPEAGQINNAIFGSAKSMQGFDSSGGPKGGREACAWSIDRVIANAGVQPMNSDWVPTWADKFAAGRGTQVNASEAQAGDIALSKGYQHIGICMNVGCTQVLSNSSSRASFNWVSDGNFDGVYDNSAYLSDNPQTQIWRVKK